MKIISVNVNGLRAASRKGFFSWMESVSPDVVCMQETRASFEQLSDSVFQPPGYKFFLMPAQKPGYSGVGIYTRIEPLAVIKGFGDRLSVEEGRYLEIHFDELIVASLYLPSGSASDEAQAKKYNFMETFKLHLDKISANGKRCIICGDWNIAHKTIDLSNWKANQKYSGFLPEERAWMDSVLDEKAGWLDGFRVVNTQPEQYTWWSNRGKAWEKNIGWRIDYQIVSNNLVNYIENAFIYTDERFSDHAPLVMQYRF